MTIRRSLIAVFSMALVGTTACSDFDGTGGPSTTRKDCTQPGLCEVDVMVKACVPTTVEKIIVNKSGAAVEIRWNAPAGYVFTQEGISFQNSPVIDQKPGIQGHGERWIVVDRPNGQAYTSKYRIQVKSTSTPGTICTGPDPVIVNE